MYHNFEAFIRIFLAANFFLNQTLLTFLLCETNLNDSIDSGNFPVRSYLPLIRKDSSNYVWFCSLCESTSFCTGLISRKLCRFLSFRLALLQSVSYFFFLYRSPSLSLRTVFDSISSNIDEVLSINPSANVFFFGDFNTIISTGLPNLVELINLVNSVIIFLSQMTLLRWLSFLLGSQAVILIVLLF